MDQVGAQDKPRNHPFLLPSDGTQRILFLKTDTNPYTLHPIRATRRGPDPNRPTYGSTERGYDLGAFVRGGGGRLPIDQLD